LSSGIVLAKSDGAVPILLDPRLDGTCAVTLAGPGTIGSGQVIATGTVRDRAGNTATATRTYTVTTPCHLCVTAANGTSVQVDGTSSVSVTEVAKHRFDINRCGQRPQKLLRSGRYRCDPPGDQQGSAFEAFG
jgi:hypothetical protein